MAAVTKDTEILDQQTLRNFPPGRRYLIGVSGGRDSVALLHALLACSYRKLVVCHLNHRLRGRSSEADARFVASLAKKHELGFELGSVDVAKRAKAEKRSIETAAREERYVFFSRIARRRRCTQIFLGHHADDLVETFLINLFRGAATQGLRSIQPISSQQISATKLTIIRPLLGAWRKEIDQYIAAHRLKFREDATNEQLIATRNRIRHRIIPFLEKEFGREIRKTIWRTAVISGEENTFLENSLPQLKAKPRVQDLRKLPIALQRRAIRAWLRDHAIAEISFDVIERVGTLLDATRGPAKINLPNDRHARRRAGELFIE